MKHTVEHGENSYGEDSPSKGSSSTPLSSHSNENPKISRSFDCQEKLQCRLFTKPPNHLTLGVKQFLETLCLSNKICLLGRFIL